jgi:hypothetical protein
VARRRCIRQVEMSKPRRPPAGLKLPNLRCRLCSR